MKDYLLPMKDYLLPASIIITALIMYVSKQNEIEADKCALIYNTGNFKNGLAHISGLGDTSTDKYIQGLHEDIKQSETRLNVKCFNYRETKQGELL